MNYRTENVVKHDGQLIKANPDAAPIPFISTWLQGGVDATFAELVAAFGQPGEGDEYKVAFEWVIQFEDGTRATLYDWKSTSLYDVDMQHPDHLKAPGAVVHWHIGGTTRAAVDRVLEALGRKA